MRRLIVCADDFGRDIAINEAVEAASRDGILSCASLMVAAPAAADAVARARLLPGLRVGLRYFFLPGVRRLLAAEIRAQFEAFRATGLALDHVNAHQHMHLHPVVARLIVEIGRSYGMR